MKNKLIVCLLCGLMSVSFTAAKKPGFAVWQLCAQGPSQMNSYVFVTDRGRVVVLDGGTAADAPFLRGFVAALGNRVDKWIVTHPHVDHMGALTEILKDPRQMIIDTVYQSPMTDEQLRTDMNRKKLADTYYEALRDSGLPVVNLTEPGLEMKIDGMNLKVLGVAHPSILTNAYNNASIVLRVWDRKKSMVFLGDTGVESGKMLLEGRLQTPVGLRLPANGASRPAGMRRAFLQIDPVPRLPVAYAAVGMEQRCGRRFRYGLHENDRDPPLDGRDRHYGTLYQLAGDREDRVGEFAARAPFGRFARRTAPF